MFPIIQVGRLAIQAPGLILLLGFWIGLSLMERYSRNHEIPGRVLSNLVFVSLLGGFAGSRAVYLLRFPQALLNNPASLFSLNPGLFDYWSGLTFTILIGFIYRQKKHLPLWTTLDSLTPLIAIMMIALPIARLAFGAGFGTAANLPWSIELWGARRHPAQIYEALSATIILGIMLLGTVHWRNSRPRIYFLVFCALSAASRLLLEAFRGDSRLVLGSVRVEQVAAWIILAICLYCLYRKQVRSEIEVN